MSRLDPLLVRQVARLAHVDLDEPAIDGLRRDLAAILEYVASLDDLDLGDVPPTAHASASGSTVRRDEARASLERGEALANAPDAAAGHFRVPRVLDG